MTRRDLAFVLATLGAGAQFFGAMVGQGMLGHGLLFGLAGSSTGNIAAVIGLLAAGVALVAAVRLMFVADARTTGRVLVATAVVGSLAAGPIYLATALPTLLGGLIASRSPEQADAAANPRSEAGLQAGSSR
jgi:hypothetical protein